MMDGGGMGGWWMWGGSIVFIALVVLIVVVLMHQTSSHADGQRADESRSADAILSDRFARGEIDEDEYRRRRDALRR